MSNLNRLPLEVNNLAISFIYLYQYFAFSVSQDDAITIQEWCTSSVDVGGGKIPMCLFGPSSLSSFLAIFSCVGVGRNVKKVRLEVGICTGKRGKKACGVFFLGNQWSSGISACIGVIQLPHVYATKKKTEHFLCNCVSCFCSFSTLCIICRH